MSILDLIWQLTFALSLLALLMFACLIVRRAWDELRARKLSARRQGIRRKIYMLFELDQEQLRQRCASPDYFAHAERRLLHEECLALCQVIRGHDQACVIELMRWMHFHRDDLRDLRRGSEDHRFAAAVSLRYFNDAQTRKALVAALQDRSGEVALAAAHSLYELGALPPLDTLLPQLAERGLLQTAACRTLIRKIAMQQPVLLLQALSQQGKRAGIRALLAEGMGYSCSYEVLPSLQELALDTDIAVRVEALRALARLEHPAATAVILRCLEDDHAEVRAVAAQAAGDLGLEVALPHLEKLLAADNWVLRFNAALSLYRLGLRGRRVLLRCTRQAGLAGRTANLVLSEKGVAALMPAR